MKRCELDKALRRYYRAIRKRLLCPARLRRRTLEQLQSGVEDFLDAHPGADMAQVTARFGTPEQVADDVLSALEPRELRRYARRVHVARAVVAALLAGLVIWYGTICVLRLIFAYKKPEVIVIGPAQSVDSIPPKPTD